MRVDSWNDLREVVAQMPADVDLSTLKGDPLYAKDHPSEPAIKIWSNEGGRNPKIAVLEYGMAEGRRELQKLEVFSMGNVYRISENRLVDQTRWAGELDTTQEWIQGEDPEASMDLNSLRIATPWGVVNYRADNPGSLLRGELPRGVAESLYPASVRFEPAKKTALYIGNVVFSGYKDYGANLRLITEIAGIEKFVDALESRSGITTVIRRALHSR